MIDALFLRQVWAGNETMLLDLAAGRRPPLGRARLHYFLLNKGPWSRLDDNEPFVPGAPAEARSRRTSIRPARRRPRSRRGSRRCRRRSATRATGFFTTIRRDADGKFVAVPYSLEYQGELARVGGAAARGRGADRRSRR